MPLDGHSYLVSQGWRGKGTGLRDGAISRPITVAQKKNLAGLGKDRDEAFPFWDHVFSAAASAIKVSIDDSDDESSGDREDKKSDATKPAVTFKLTQTGIISNRRPVHGTPADSSGTSTPSSSSDPSSSTTTRYSVMTIAKRDAARRGLYSRFFRGPTLGPDTTLEKTARESSPSPQYAVDDKTTSMAIADMMKQATALSSSADGKATASQDQEKQRKTKDRDVKKEKKRRKDEKEERRRVKEARKKEKAQKKEIERQSGTEAKDKQDGGKDKKEKDKKKRRKEDSKKEKELEAKLQREVPGLLTNPEMIAQPPSLKGKERAPLGEESSPPPEKKRKSKSDNRKSETDNPHEKVSSKKSSKTSKRSRTDEEGDDHSDASTSPKKRKKRRHDS